MDVERGRPVQGYPKDVEEEWGLALGYNGRVSAALPDGFGRIIVFVVRPQ